MYRFVYKTTNLLNGMYYIGVHKTDNLEDGYLGSGRKLLPAIREFGKESFSREILQFAETDEEALMLEKSYVNKDVVADPLSYNMTTGGAGRLCFGTPCNFSEEGLASLRASGSRYVGENNPFYGKEHSDKTKKILSQMASEKVGEKNPFFGKSHTEEYKKKASDLRKGLNKSNCERILRMSWKRSTGWWCTPFGCFIGDRDAAYFTGINRNRIRSYCKNPDKLVEPNYQVPEEYWGKTWRENGFYFIPKQH